MWAIGHTRIGHSSLFPTSVRVGVEPSSADVCDTLPIGLALQMGKNAEEKWAAGPREGFVCCPSPPGWNGK